MLRIYFRHYFGRTRHDLPLCSFSAAPKAKSNLGMGASLKAVKRHEAREQKVAGISCAKGVFRSQHGAESAQSRLFQGLSKANACRLRAPADIRELADAATNRGVSSN
jgi:hypothetical protein